VKFPPRQSSQAFVRLPAWITDGSSRREYVAFVRDISSTGAFFYAEFNPQHGQRISIELEYWNERNRIRLRLTGKVVKVVQPSPTTGIAMAFDSPRNDIPRTESGEVNGQALVSLPHQSDLQPVLHQASTGLVHDRFANESPACPLTGRADFTSDLSKSSARVALHPVIDIWSAPDAPDARSS
jgi:hypothetical protein